MVLQAGCSRPWRNRPWDCVVIGGGIRIPSRDLSLFERVANAVGRGAPGMPIAFNTSPGDAAARWLAPSPQDHD